MEEFCSCAEMPLRYKSTKSPKILILYMVLEDDYLLEGKPINIAKEIEFDGKKYNLKALSCCKIFPFDEETSQCYYPPMHTYCVLKHNRKWLKVDNTTRTSFDLEQFESSLSFLLFINVFHKVSFQKINGQQPIYYRSSNDRRRS